MALVAEFLVDADRIIISMLNHQRDRLITEAEQHICYFGDSGLDQDTEEERALHRVNGCFGTGCSAPTRGVTQKAHPRTSKFVSNSGQIVTDQASKRGRIIPFHRVIRAESPHMNLRISGIPSPKLGSLVGTHRSKIAPMSTNSWAICCIAHENSFKLSNLLDFAKLLSAWIIASLAT